MRKRRNVVGAKKSDTNARNSPQKPEEKKQEGSDDPAKSASERVDIELVKNDSSTGTMKEMIEGAVVADDVIDADLTYIQTTLRHFPWYHGMIQSAHVLPHLRWDNSYLVRRSGETQKSHDFFCLSLRQSNRITHYAFKLDDGFWTCPKIPFEMDASLVFSHIHTLLDHWSLKYGGLIPVPRSKKVIYHDDVKLEKKLGEGEFGEVWKGSVVIDGVTKDCAVKKIKGGKIKRYEISSFFHEAKIMALFNHDNIIRFYGECTLISPMMAVMELAAGGVVRSYLRVNKPSHDVLTGFVHDVARGMEHLTSLRVIHRDLAARNCLLDEKHVVKISDFGLSVRAEEIRVKNLKQAPIRWLSPETIKFGTFNEKTDVWSFGVVVWEFFTYCKKVPLWPKNMKEATMDIKEVDKPHRFSPNLKQQPSKDIVTIMEHCTRHLGKDRPKFRTIVLEVEKIVEKIARGGGGVPNAQSRRRQPARSVLQKSGEAQSLSITGTLRRNLKKDKKNKSTNPLMNRSRQSDNSLTPPGSAQNRSQNVINEKEKNSLL